MPIGRRSTVWILTAIWNYFCLPHLKGKARQEYLDGDLYFHTVMPSREVSMPKLRPLVADFERKAVKGYAKLWKKSRIMMERPAFRWHLLLRLPHR